MSLQPIVPNDARATHNIVSGSDDVRIHYVRRGKGPTVILLHGWPGFWYDWRTVIPALAQRADVVAPDFRGFGRSDNPSGAAIDTHAPEIYADDILALMDNLNIDRALLVGHDIGAVVLQALAQRTPERFPRLVLINPPYAGIGRRRFEPDASAEFWYYNFHKMPWAQELVAYNRDTVRIYLRHFYDHWVGRKESLRADEFEAIVDMYTRPGAFAGSISYYRARAEQRRRGMIEAQPKPIIQPTRILWGARDPVIKVVWADRLGEFFTSMSLSVLPDAGHFLPFEAPNEVLAAIDADLAMMKDI